MVSTEEAKIASFADPAERQLFAVFGTDTVRTLAFVAIAAAGGEPQTSEQVTERLLASVAIEPEEAERLGLDIDKECRRLLSYEQIDRAFVPHGRTKKSAYLASPETSEQKLAHAGVALAWRWRHAQMPVNLDSIWRSERISKDVGKLPGITLLPILTTTALANEDNTNVSEQDLFAAAEGSPLSRSAIRYQLNRLTESGCLTLKSSYDGLKDRVINNTTNTQHLKRTGRRMLPISQAIYETALGMPKGPISAQELSEQVRADYPQLGEQEVRVALTHMPPLDLQLVENPGKEDARTSYAISDDYREPILDLVQMNKLLAQDPDYATGSAQRALQIPTMPNVITTLLRKAGYGASEHQEAAADLPKQG